MYSLFVYVIADIIQLITNNYDDTNKSKKKQHQHFAKFVFTSSSSSSMIVKL